MSVQSGMRRARSAVARPCRPRGVPTPNERPHEEAQVEAADVDQQPFQDVRVPAQMRAPHPARLVEMRIRAFQPLAASPLQGVPARAADAPTIRIHRVARRRLLLPVPRGRDRGSAM